MKKDKVAILVRKCLNLFSFSVSQKTEKLLVQIFKFGLVGGFAFIIDFVFLYLFKELCHFPVLLANTLSFCISVIYNYLASVKWVFEVDPKQNKQKQFIFFMFLSICGLFLNDFIMWVCVHLLTIYYLLAKIIATAIVMVFNFVTRKIFLESHSKENK